MEILASICAVIFGWLPRVVRQALHPALVKLQEKASGLEAKAAALEEELRECRHAREETERRYRPEERRRRHVKDAHKQGRPICGCHTLGTVMVQCDSSPEGAVVTFECPECGHRQPRLQSL